MRGQVLLVGGDVAQFRQRLQLGQQLGCPRRQLVGIGILQAELILGAADAVFHRQVLHRLHVQRDALNPRNLLLQSLHDGGDVIVALIARPEIDLQAAAVGRGVGAVHSDKRGEAFDVLVLQDRRRQFALPFRHCGKGNTLRRVGNAHDHTRVLHREKALGHHDVHPDGRDQSANGDQQSYGLMLQDELYGAAIERDGVVEGTLRPLVHAPVLGLVPLAQQQRAHHRSQGQRNDRREENGDAQGHRELAEQPAHDVAHEEQRNEHGNQRDGQRHNREPDLGGTLQRGFQRSVAFLDVALDVLDHHNGVIHHEAGGNGQGHQGKVVEGIAQQVHHPEGAHQRQRQGDAGDDGGRQST